VEFQILIEQSLHFWVNSREDMVRSFLQAEWVLLKDRQDEFEHQTGSFICWKLRNVTN